MSSLSRASSVLPPGRFADHVSYLERVDSTNSEARRLGREGAPDGTLVIADHQTAGRGRRQRAWISPPGTGLYASLLLRPPFPAQESGAAVQLLAGIAVAEYLGELLPRKPLLRWPNDCYVADRKIAGVLVEAETSGGGFDFLVCGIGINVNQDEAGFPEQLRERATSVRLQLGHTVERMKVLGGVLAAFDTWETAWRRHGLEPVRERWLELSPETVRGRVSVQTDEGLLEGDTDGLAEDGRLRVRDEHGVHHVSVGEVVRLRPA